jgi:DNA modification methylase
MEIKAREIKMVDIDHLVENPKNNNKHPDDQIERLVKIIKNTGFRNPLTVSNRSGFVLCGHGRITAARKAGLKELPVIFQDFKDEAEEYAHLTADNAIAKWAEIDLGMVNSEMLDLGPDFDIDMLGLKDFVIEPIEKFDPQSDEDEIPEVVHPITVRGDIWILGNHRLMCGDSTMIDDVEKLMSGEKADMVFTDPPYGINLKIGGGNGNGLAKKTDYNYIKNDDSINCAIDVINLINGLGVRKQLYWGANYFLTALENTKCFICWDKRGSLPHDDFCGTEIAWTNCDVHTKTIKVAWKGMIKEGESGKRLHPNQKPLLLIEKCFEYLKAENSILDLFLGSGSTLIACEKTNRKCYGMELDEKYCDVIINRWQNFAGKQATLESTGQTYEELKAVRNV